MSFEPKTSSRAPGRWSARGHLQNFLAAQGLVVAGAALMEWSGSCVPMALAASAAAMLTARVVKRIWQGNTPRP